MSTVVVQLQGTQILVNGPLTHETASLALAQSKALLPKGKEIEINLSGVSHCDSASIAFLIALLRLCKTQHTALKCSHLPDQMRDLSTVCGLDSILPIIKD